MIQRRALLAAPALLLAPGTAKAWPDRSITLMHGFGAGGAADTICRLLAPALGETLGKPVVVEPRPGAGGNIASLALSRSPADGHTLGLLTGSHGVAAAFGKANGFDPVDGFDWITIALRYAFVLVVRADSPWQDLPALIPVAKRGNGAVQYGTLGPGSSHHLTGELLSAAAGIQMTPVPYRSDVAGLTGVLGGELPVMISTTVGAMSMLQDGKLRPLAVTSARRSRQFPQLPTVAETLPGYESTTWAGLVTPRGAPAAVQERLHEAMVSILAQPALRQRLEELVDGEVAPTPRAETRGVLVAEIAKWKALIAARGLTAE